MEAAKQKERVTPIQAANGGWAKKLDPGEFPGWDYIAVGELQLLHNAVSRLVLELRRPAPPPTHAVADGILASLQPPPQPYLSPRHQRRNRYAKLIAERGAMTASQLAAATGEPYQRVMSNVRYSQDFVIVNPREQPYRFDLAERAKKVLGVTDSELASWSELAGGMVG